MSCVDEKDAVRVLSRIFTAAKERTQPAFWPAAQAEFTSAEYLKY